MICTTKRTRIFWSLVFTTLTFFSVSIQAEVASDLRIKLGRCGNSGPELNLVSPKRTKEQTLRLELWDHELRNWEMVPHEITSTNVKIGGLQTGYFYRLKSCTDEGCDTSRLQWLPVLICSSERTEEAFSEIWKPVYVLTNLSEEPMRFEPPDPGEKTLQNIVKHNQYSALRALWTMPRQKHGFAELEMSKPVIASPIERVSFADQVLAKVYAVYQHVRTRGAALDLFDTALDPRATLLFEG